MTLNDEEKADYQDYITFDAEQVATRIQEAESFVDAICQHLGQSIP